MALSETIVPYNSVILDDPATLYNDPGIQWVEEIKIDCLKKVLNTCFHLMVT